VNPVLQQLPPSLQKPLLRLAIDFEPGPQPAWWRVIVASVVAIVGSLIADALIAAAAIALWPHLKGYQHFMFADYSKLTVIGIIGAAIGWPIVTRISSRPARLYGILAILVTLVLLLPDVYIAIQGQPIKAVLALVVMHLAIAIVTYFSMVLIAPAGARTHVAAAR